MVQGNCLLETFHAKHEEDFMAREGMLDRMKSNTIKGLLNPEAIVKNKLRRDRIKAKSQPAESAKIKTGRVEC